jgi:aerobic-type carbon monoxide dehydrogenase small subunit (CoxS/CutS family)
MTTEIVRLTVNGRVREALAEPRKTLVDFLREDLHLTGTHVGCEHGVCGACTVLVDGVAVRSCLMLAVQAREATVRTIEGLESEGKLHPLQDAFRQSHSFQCGFCTPGFMMTALALLDEDPTVDEEELREQLSGNLCRCTGYQSIVNGVLLAAEKLRQVRSPAGNDTSAEDEATPGEAGL